MPTYTFKNTETEEIFDKMMKISEYDEFLKNNPNVIRHHASAPGLAEKEPKPPSDFQKYVVDSIQRRNPGASPSRKYSTPKEW